MTYGYNNNMQPIADRIAGDVTKQVKPSSGAVVTAAYNNRTSKEPTDKADGYINVTLTVADQNYYETSTDKQPDYTSVARQAKLTKGEIRIETLQQAHDAVANALDAKYGSNKATNEVTAEEVLSVAKEALGTADYCDPRFEVRVTKCEPTTKASAESSGILNIVVRISRSIWSRTNVTKNYTISQFVTWINVVGKVKEALENPNLVLDNNVTADRIKGIANDVIGANTAITVDFGVKETTDADGNVTPKNEHFQFEESQHASEGKDGYVLGTLIFTYTTKEILPSGKEKARTETAKLAFVNAATQDSDKAYVKVKAFDSKVTAAKNIGEYFKDGSFTTTMATAAADIKAAAEQQIYSPNGNITVEIAKKPVDGKDVDDIEETTAATFKTAGVITAKLNVFMKGDATPEVITVTVTVPQKTQTLKEAEEAANEVLGQLDYSKITNAAGITAELDKVLAEPAVVNNFAIADGKLTAKIVITSSTGSQKTIPIEKTITAAETPAE